MGDYEYSIRINKHDLKGYFFQDDDFGSFFFTVPTKENIGIEEQYCLEAFKDQISLSSGTQFNAFVLSIVDRHVYAFASQQKLDCNYCTLEDIQINSKGVFSSEEILELLSQICILPTGNYMVGNVQDYISVVETIIQSAPEKEYFFRGHYNYNYILVPSLYRKKTFYENENFMYMDFKTHFYNELSDKKYIEILTTMQHYKMPTRLLDTTSNPLVALYMACDRPNNYKPKGASIGEVVVMHEERKSVKYSDSNVVTLLSSLAVLETHYKQEMYEKIMESIEKKDPSIYQNSIAFKRFVAEVKTELPLFDLDFFSPEVLLHPRHVKVGMINERIIAQAGNFILFGLCNYATGQYVKLETVHQNRLFVVHRDKIVEQLERLNINMGTMYPDKDHMSSTITKMYD